MKSADKENKVESVCMEQYLSFFGIYTLSADVIYLPRNAVYVSVEINERQFLQRSLNTVSFASATRLTKYQ